MKAIRYEKLTSPPGTLAPNTVYLTKNSQNTVDISFSDTLGTVLYPLATPSKSGISIYGPSSIGVNETVTYTITTYDDFTTYTLDAGTAAATISRSGNKVTITAVSTAGTKTFSINGTVFTVTVSLGFIRTPTVTTSDGITKNALVGLELISSSFTSTSSTTHLSTDWEIATDVNFTSLLDSSYDDVSNLTSFSVSGLAQLTTYYVRVRHKDGIYTPSSWSDTLVIATGSTPSLDYLGEKLIPNDGKSLDKYGHSIAMTPNGKRLVIGSPNSEPGKKLPNYGSAYVYVDIQGYWRLEAKLVAPDKNINDNFGSSVDISDDGCVIVIGSPNADNLSTLDVGKAYIFRRKGKGWKLDLTAMPSTAANSHTGCSVSVSGNGTRVSIGSYTDTGSGLGVIYNYEYTSGSWLLKNNIPTPENISQQSFSKSISLNYDGSKLLVGSPYANSNKGAAYIYTYATSWSGLSINSTSSVSGDLYGYSVYLSRNGKRAIIGSPNKTVSTVSGAGGVYILNYTSSWTEETNISMASPTTNARYGTYVTGDVGLTRAVISAIGTNDPISNRLEVGSVFSYIKTSSWSLESILTPRGDSLEKDHFGNSIAISSANQKILVGSPSGSGITNSGAVFTFTSSI